MPPAVPICAESVETSGMKQIRIFQVRSRMGPKTGKPGAFLQPGKADTIHRERNAGQVNLSVPEPRIQFCKSNCAVWILQIIECEGDGPTHLPKPPTLRRSRNCNAISQLKERGAIRSVPSEKRVPASSRTFLFTPPPIMMDLGSFEPVAVGRKVN